MKSTIPVFLCVLGVACARRSQPPAGASPALTIGGTYAAHESLYSSTCSGASARKEAFRVDVEHASGAGSLKLTTDGMPYDAKVSSNGNFSVAPQTIRRGSTTTTTSLSGRFTDTGFFARLTLSVIEPVIARRPGEPTTRTCDYQFRWEAEKM